MRFPVSVVDRRSCGRRAALAWLLICLAAVPDLPAAEPAQPAAAPETGPAPHEFDPAGLRGTLLLAGPEADPVVVCATLKSAELRRLDLVSLGGVPDVRLAQLQELAPELQGLLAARPSEWAARLASERLAIPPENVSASALWIHAGNDVDVSRVPWRALAALVRSRLDHDGTVIATGTMAAGLAEQFEVRSEGGSHWVTGSGVLPVNVFSAGRAASGEKVQTGIAGPEFAGLQAGRLGLCLDRKGIVQLRGRRVQVPEDAAAGATFILPVTEGRPETLQQVTREQPADLTMLRRAAVARALPPFPPETCPTPEVPRGTLLIVGGGGFTDEMVSLFVDRAGGAAARIVIIPTANPDGSFNRSEPARFERAGAGKVSVLHTRSREVARTDAFLEPLREATGVWFTGGRQWRLLDAYEGTPVVDLCHAVLDRGGIIGGSSAGATIQGEYLVRGHPLGNEAMIAEGYEHGFAFLPGTAIDQHFSQRGREADMIQLKLMFPQLVGIGIDEATAIVVTGTRADVIGAAAVRIYDCAAGPNSPGEPPACVVLKAGDAYDFRSHGALPRPAP